MEGGSVCLARSELLALLTWEVRDFQRLPGTQSHLSILGDGALLDSKGNFTSCNESPIHKQGLYKGGRGSTQAEKRRGCYLCSENVLPRACRAWGQTPRFKVTSKEVMSS